MFKLKKLAGALAVTIALVHGFSAIPVKAEEAVTSETCTHKECGNYSDSANSLCSNCYYDYTRTYVSNKDGISHVSTSVCKGCGNTYVENNGMCFFQDGTCNMCGQEKNSSECSHENCNGVLEETGYSICSDCEQNQYAGGLKYVKINDVIHYRTSTCKCGDETGNRVEEEHFIYDTEGRCACGHLVISDPSDDNNGNGDNSNDGNTEIINCPFCGANGQYYEWYTPYGEYHVLLKYYGCCNKSVEDVSTKAQHNFSEGSCTECGYKEGGAVCKHADCGRAVNGESDVCSYCTYIDKYIISSNADTHTYVNKCYGCGSILEDMGTVTEAHSFYSNIYCVWCGYYNSKPSGKPVEESTPSITEKENVQTKAEEIAQATEAVIQAEVAMSVTEFVSAEATSLLPKEVKDSTGDEAVYNLSKITTTSGFIAAVEKMLESNKTFAQKKEAVTFYSSTPIAFNTSSLTALADASAEFVYMFKHEGHLYKITIPAGAKVDLAGQRFAGPLYIGAQLGTSVLIK